MISYLQNNFSYNVNWQIKINPIYRLLDNISYLDDFFNKGEIMLSCFEKFKNYDNEIQGDPREGHGGIIGEDSEKTTHMLMYESGQNSHIMSTTKKLDENIIKSFNAKCAIEILDPTYFGIEIAKKLPYIDSGVEGDCIYVDSKAYFIQDEGQNRRLFEKTKLENNHHTHELLGKITMGRELFLKDNNYSYQNEYRLVWFSRNEVRDSLVITCPEATECCKRIIF